MIQKIKFFFITLVFFSGFLIVQNALAIGVSPSTVVVDDLVNGLKVDKTIFLSRANPAQADFFKVTTSGEGARYIVLGKTTIELPKGQQQVPYTFSIQPKNAPGGSYQARVTFNGTTPTETSSTGNANVGFVSGAAVTVRFNVTNKEVKNFTIESVQVYETEVSQPFIFDFWLKNDGNVDAKPDFIEIEFTDETDSSNVIKDKIDKSAIEVVGPATTSRVAVSSNIKPEQGRYKGSIIFYTNDKEIFRKDNLIIIVHPIGTLAQKAEMTEFILNGDRFAPGDLVKIDATIKNIGELPIEPILKVQIEQDGKILDLLKSNKKSIIKNNEAKYSLTFRPENNGDYQVNASFEFGAKETDVQKAQFTVSTIVSINKYLWLIVALVVAVTVIVAIYFLLHRRSKHKKRRK